MFLWLLGSPHGRLHHVHVRVARPAPEAGVGDGCIVTHYPQVVVAFRHSGCSFLELHETSVAQGNLPFLLIRASSTGVESWDGEEPVIDDLALVRRVPLVERVHVRSRVLEDVSDTRNSIFHTPYDDDASASGVYGRTGVAF